MPLLIWQQHTTLEFWGTCTIVNSTCGTFLMFNCGLFADYLRFFIIWERLWKKCLVQFHTFSQSPVSHGNSNFSPLRVDGAIFILEIPPLLHRCSASGPRRRPTREHIAARVLPKRIGTLLDRRGVENGVRIIERSSLLL